MEYFYSIFCLGDPLSVCVVLLFIYMENVFGDAKRKRPINLTSFLYFRCRNEPCFRFILVDILWLSSWCKSVFCFDEGTVFYI